MSIRKDSVAGQFYPAQSIQIDEMIEQYNTILDENITDNKVLEYKPRAVIVPHAGYVYSAFTANIAFRLLKNTKPKRIIVIGPSHRVYLRGTSISEYDSYETPYGEIPIDTKLVQTLKNEFTLSFTPEAHHEHSTEVQMPFIKKYIPNASVIELVYGDENPQNIVQIIDFLLKDPENAIVISTDLSHYYDIQKAKTLDNICLQAIDTLNPDILHQGCEACGKIGVEAMIYSAKHNDLKPVILDYRTSADASKDNSSVVGYTSVAFI